MVIKMLDRYIVRTFLHSLLMWFIVFMVLRIIIDLFVNMDEFTENDLPFGEVFAFIVNFYFFNSFMYFTEMGGIIIVAAAAFSVARMNHTNELTAMLASGVSLHRVVWPIILSAMLMGGLIIIDQEFIIPNVRNQLIRQQDEAGQKGERFQISAANDVNNSVWQSGNYDPAEQKMLYPMTILRDNRPAYEFQYLAHIAAESSWPGTFENRKGWQLSRAAISHTPGKGKARWRAFQRSDKVVTTVGPEQLTQIGRQRWEKQNPGRKLPAGMSIEYVDNVRAKDDHFTMNIRAEKFIPGPVLRAQIGEHIEEKVLDGVLIRPQFDFLAPGGRVLATIHDDRAVWVWKRPDGKPLAEGQCYWKLDTGLMFQSTDITPAELKLRQSGKWLDFLSSGELTGLLKLKRSIDPQAVLQAKYIRFANPLNNLVMLLLGLPFILSRQRNIKASAGLCILMVGSFYVFIYLCRYMGFGDFWAAFLPVLIFGPVSVIMLDSIKT